MNSFSPSTGIPSERAVKNQDPHSRVGAKRPSAGWESHHKSRLAARERAEGVSSESISMLREEAKGEEAGGGLIQV